MGSLLIERWAEFGSITISSELEMAIQMATSIHRFVCPSRGVIAVCFVVIFLCRILRV